MNILFDMYFANIFLFAKVLALISFSSLGKIGKVVNDLENDFRDGVCLLLLIGLLEGNCKYKFLH